MAKDRWHELCEQVEEDDGLPTWDEAGHWTKDKLFFWHQTQRQVIALDWTCGVLTILGR